MSPKVLFVIHTGVLVHIHSCYSIFLHITEYAYFYHMVYNFNIGTQFLTKLADGKVLIKPKY